MGGQPRNYLAAIDVTTGEVTSWNPGVSNGVSTLAVSGSAVYAGGNFTSAGGEVRNHLAAIDATTGQLTNWNPSANSRVWSIAVSDS